MTSTQRSRGVHETGDAPRRFNISRTDDSSCQIPSCIQMGKERTSSLTSGRHAGHYKSAAENEDL
jgi:hypothetical protein